jgi:hypothetical protein
MNTIREKLNQPLIVGIGALIIGVIIGLIVAWGIWPVKWIDATPNELNFDYKVEYLHMAIEAYGKTGDVAQAQTRYEELGPGAKEAMDYVMENPEGLSSDLISDFGGHMQGVTPQAEAEKTSVWRIIIPVLCVLFLVLVALLVYFVLLRNRGARVVTPPSPAMQAAEARRQAPMTDYTAAGTAPPIAQFMASYKLGDDLFDDSFSIDSQSGEFLGECGVGISETIGVGDPKKVTAFEVWLFDKNDIQTVTKVLMSAHAFSDAGIRDRLATKGELIQIEPGIDTVLDTQTLTLVARVVDMSYGEGAMPDQSFLDHLLLELAVWQKTNA